MKLGSLGEFGLIERIRAAVRDGDEVLLGIGDDCAATALPPGEILLTSTDLLIEGVHFRRDWTDLFTLGRKCVAVNVSDIAAMGGTPRQLYLGVALPAGMETGDFDALIAGVLAAAADYGATLAGGDTCRSPGPLLISVTVQGSVPPGEMLRRNGARPGDAIYVSGSLGASALALRELLAGRTPAAELARCHHDPGARVVLGRELARRGLATAMIDLSDGLVADLGHVLKASGVGGRVAATSLPLAPELQTAVEREPALLELALAGGEDYELLFTAASAARTQIEALAAELELPLTRVGEVVAGDGVTVHDRHGAPLTLGHRGYNHFA